jgi:hypothetical protein
VRARRGAAGRAPGRRPGPWSWGQRRALVQALVHSS